MASPKTTATIAAVSENGHAAEHAKAYLTLAQIREAASHLERERDVFVDSLGGSVRVRSLRLAEIRDIGERVEQETRGEGDRVLMMLYTAHAGLVEPEIPEADFKELADDLPGFLFAINQAVNDLTDGAGASGAAEVVAAQESFRKMG